VSLLTISQAMVADGEEVGEEEEDAWYLRRVDSGLFTLQTVDYILAFLAMEDDGVCPPLKPRYKLLTNRR
jgi:beta-catenin-like protein 1